MVGHVRYQETGGGLFQAVVLVVQQHAFQFTAVVAGKGKGTLQRSIPAARLQAQHNKECACRKKAE
ncbi:hypothetical protein, partial [uncultured Bacteroides sp.]|uniref:hypothetical protein n=1 Tax=uncultured Bacteroides sp. TaxID=162156 RepID=UPI00259B9069